jgi:EAL domain-containing protein (putative c-di-GMP-specific phosphodiesterase class I)
MMSKRCAMRPGVEMSKAELKTCRIDMQQEKARLALLRSTGILDTEPEANYDAITRLAATYFRADSATIGFADESRIWVKSGWGPHLRELPRKNSLFDMVVAQNGPVVFFDFSKSSCCKELRRRLKRPDIAFIASVPVRFHDGTILGVLNIFDIEARFELSPGELTVLESLAEIVSSQIELHRLRNASVRKTKRRRGAARGNRNRWPQKEDLQQALEERQFVLHYQPEVDLTNLMVVGLEALIRWQHPERGLIAPGEFIPLAEESGLILPIGDWVMAEVCNQVHAWCREDPGNDSLRVCVNLSARQFLRKGLADHVESLLLQSGVSSRQIGLEMTESSLITNMNTAHKVFQCLRELGISLAIDDFGTGYSSLNHLHSFPFDILKIDRSFVARITTGEQSMQIVRTIIDLARALRMDVVAEGVETFEQFQLLRQLGCRYAQGYLFSHPLPVHEVTQLLRLPGRVLPVPEAASPWCDLVAS